MARRAASAALAFLWGLITFPALGDIIVSNSNTIAIPANAPNVTVGAASPYPSTIVVEGLKGVIADVNVKITGLSHTFADDIDILLIGPNGAAVMLMAGAGGSTNLQNLDFTFDDQALLPMPNTAPALIAGTYKPTNYEPLQELPVPAPEPPFGDALAVFNGVNPSGIWKLYVADDGLRDFGAMAGGWALEFNLGGCNGDIDANLTVDVDDLISVINQWGDCGSKCATACPADTNGSCTVDVDDLLVVINAWGDCN